MVKSFRGKALRAYWIKGDASKIGAALRIRVRSRLAALDDARAPEDMDLPGFDFHGLQGKPKRFSVHVNGPWCITFEWVGDDAEAVDLENYH
jgi:proteic killer suppression protein